MFQVYCPHHQADVLLSFGNIISVINHPDGIEMHWRCWCGEEGRQEMSRPAVPRLDVPRLDVPRLDVPRLDVPRLDVPRLDVPRLDVTA